MPGLEINSNGGFAAVGRQVDGGGAIDLFLSGYPYGQPGGLASGLYQARYRPTTGWHTDQAGALFFEPVLAAETDRTFPYRPSAVSWDGAGRLDLFAVDAAGDLYHFWGEAAGDAAPSWAGGESLGRPAAGALATSPAAVSWGPDWITVFARSADRSSLQACVWDPAAGDTWRWSEAHALGWAGQPGSRTLGVAATSWAPGRVDLFGATGPSGVPDYLEHTWQQDFPGDPTWHPDHWERLPPTVGVGVTSSPVAVSWLIPEQRILVVYCEGNPLTGQGVGSTRWAGSAFVHHTVLEPSEDAVVSYPALCSWGRLRADVFFLLASGRLQHGWSTAGGDRNSWQWETFPIALPL